ncbi:MAG TPA: gliding motility-associated ABC transporter ATP-binding subunit GldA [Bacteroidales bacterium]|nr:gliding motility-associated ABC transporter ATP-binding subunit GldA [Bacteroidales bacterium]
MSIKVQNITKKYGKQKALNKVSFEIKSGEIVGLLGPNGAGKSTLMKILTGFIPPTSGEAFVCDFDVREQSLEVRKKVGYLAEQNPLYLEMYVKEFLIFIAGLHKLGKNKNSRVKQMIELTGLEAEQNKKIGALSKGYRQRVGLAQALMHDPEVLILDEPTTGLDPNQILEIRNLIKKIGKEKTVMLSTHIMQEVEAICSRAIIINNGIIVADDLTLNMQQLLRRRNTITVEFNTNVNDDFLKKIPGVLKVTPRRGFVWDVESDDDVDVRSEIFKFAVKSNIEVLSMHKETVSMEDVFHQLTKE